MNEYIMKRINSESYRDRFVAEYLELQVRTKRLRAMLEKWDAGKLEFKPDCTRATYKIQLDAMDKYLAVMEIRGKLEGIDLAKAEKEHRENKECDEIPTAEETMKVAVMVVGDQSVIDCVEQIVGDNRSIIMTVGDGMEALPRTAQIALIRELLSVTVVDLVAVNAKSTGLCKSAIEAAERDGVPCLMV